MNSLSPSIAIAGMQARLSRQSAVDQMRRREKEKERKNFFEKKSSLMKRSLFYPPTFLLILAGFGATALTGLNAV